MTTGGALREAANAAATATEAAYSLRTLTSFWISFSKFSIASSRCSMLRQGAGLAALGCFQDGYGSFGGGDHGPQVRLAGQEAFQIV